jgi:poly(A) polymerase
LVHVFFSGGKVVEVSTFRSRSEFEEIQTEEGNIIRTDSFGTPAEDALRRDITINGLFYSISDFSLIDYVGGMADLRRGVIRTIGDPDERFQQDPARMIRVIRHASRTGFSIDDSTYRAILRHRDEIQQCSPSRIRDEFLRDLKESVVQPSFGLMLETGLLLSLFPDFQRVFGDRSPEKERNRQFFLSLFGLADQLMNRDRFVPEPVHLALLLTPFIQAITPDHPFLGEKERYLYRMQTIRLALHQILVPFSFPKEPKEVAFQILLTQPSLERAIQRGGIPKRLRMKKYFREAVLLYGILAEAKRERVPPVLRNAVPWDLLPWWPKQPKKRYRRFDR